MANVFISHASQDAGLTERLRRRLAGAGHDVFLDQSVVGGIAVGDEWEECLHARLRWADAVVCVVTSAFVHSLWCTAEIAIARTHGCRLLPVCAEPGVQHPFLQSVQHVDLSGGESAWQKLLEALRKVDVGGGSGWSDDRPPWPGLRPFHVDEHRVFFGRKAEANRLAELLRSPSERADAAMLLVVGPSGCGKSSLLRAGLLPLMAEEPGWWPLAPILPGGDPIAGLVRELAAATRAVGLNSRLADLRQRVEEGGLGTVADELLHRAPHPRRNHLLLVIDQFEELFTQTPPPRRARFAELLQPVSGGTVQVVAALRPEFLEHVLAGSEFSGLRTHTYTVKPLVRDALRSTIEGPARLAGIRVDDDLVARLVSDAGSGEALPLLAYTIAELAKGVERGDRLLLSRYEDLGGVKGALTRQADAALAEAIATGRRDRSQVIDGLLRLVTVDEHNRPARRRVASSTLPEAVTAELEPFVARRLLVTDTAGDGAVIEVAHEAFLTAWAPLVEAIVANSAALRAHRKIEQAAEEWWSAGRPTARLWERGQLAAAQADIDVRARSAVAGRRWLPTVERRGPRSGRVALSTRAGAFLRSSIRRDRRRRATITTVLAILLALVSVAAGVAVVQRQQAEQGQRLAASRLLMREAEGTLTGNPRLALQLGEAARAINPDQEMESSLAQILRSSWYAGTLFGHKNQVNAVAVAARSHLLATADLDGTVILWDVADALHPRQVGAPLSGFVEAVWAVDFSPDNRLLAVGGQDGYLALWDLTDPAEPRLAGRALAGHKNTVTSVAFSADGTLLASADSDSAFLWNLDGPAGPVALPGFGDSAEVVGFARDRPLLTARNRSSVVQWDLTDRTRPRQVGRVVPGTGDTMTAVDVSPDGHTVAVASLPSTIALWDLSNPSAPELIDEFATEHATYVDRLAFSPDGKGLVSADTSPAIFVWSVADLAEPRRVGPALTGHTASINALAWEPGGNALVSAGEDTSVIVWDLAGRTGVRPAAVPLVGHTDRVLRAAFSSSGRLLATAAGDEKIMLWDVSTPGQPRRVGPPLAGHVESITSLVFSPAGPVLTSASRDGVVVLWDVSDPLHVRPLGRPLELHTSLAISTAFSPDGRLLATPTSQNSVTFWDVSDPAHLTPVGRPLIGHDSTVTSIAFSPDGRTVATASAFDETVALWDVNDLDRPERVGEPLGQRTAQIDSVEFSPDGRYLAVARADTVALWAVTDPAQPEVVGEPLSVHAGNVWSAEFAPDGRALATANDDGAAILWDLTDPARPQVAASLGRQRGGVIDVAFSPDGSTLATTGSDKTTMLWSLSGFNSAHDHSLQRACAITGQGLSPADWSRYVEGPLYTATCTA